MDSVFAGLTGEFDWRHLILSGVVCLAAGTLAGVWLQRRRSTPETRSGSDLEETRERNARLDAALNNMTQGLCMFDASERVVVLNRRFLEMYKLSPEIVRPGCLFLDLLRHRISAGLLDGDPETFRASLMRDLATGRSTHLTHQTSDNRYILAHNQPMPGGGWVTTHEDITERRTVEAEVHEQKLKLDAALNNMSQGLCMFDSRGRVVLCNQRYLQMYDFSAEDVQPGRTLWELIELRKARGLISDDPQMYIDVLSSAIGEGRPISFELEMTDKRIIRIENSPMADGRWVATHEDITEQRRNERELREQKLHLDIALNNMSQGLCMFNADARLIFCNQRYLQMYGMSSSDIVPDMTLVELLEKRRSQGTWSRDPQQYLTELRALLASGQTVTFTVEGPGGRLISIYNRPMPDGRWVSCHEDITEQRRAETQLRERKLQLDAALDNMTQALCMFDAEGRIILFNSRYCKLMGFSSDFMKGLTFLELLKHRKESGDFTDDPERFNAAVLEAAREGKAITKIVERGSGRIHRIVVQPMITGGWVSTLEDITEQRRAEERLREQKVLLDTALNNMSQGLNMFDAAGRLMLSNERYLQMYRLPPEEAKPGSSIQDLVRARVANGTFFDVDPDEYAADLLRTMDRREPTSAEMDLTDGRVVAIVSRPMPDGSGWVVTHEDITERRRAEKERDRSQAFASTVIENVPATIAVKDARTLRYILVNKAGEAHFGVPRQAMIGRTSEEIFPPQTAELIAQHDRDLLTTGEPKLYDEHPTTTPAGSPRIVTTARLPIRDQQGAMQYLLTVIDDRTNRKRAEAQIAHMAHHDLLTALPNRAAFNACLSSTIESAIQSGESFSLMSLDIDRFKEINDVFGHGVGDRLLCEISRRLQKTAGGGFVARLGGDEFTVISTEGTQPTAAEVLANQIIESIGEEFVIDGHRLRSALSIGIAIFPADGPDSATLVANADAALYRAKSEGRGIYRFFEANMDKRLRERRALQHDLQLAIERGQLDLNYQPQARIGREVFGFEALVRWRHPTQGPIPPSTFVPLAEESGLIIGLGEWVLREACREAASWRSPLQIAINLSPVQFRHGDLPALVHSVLIETGLAPSRLELEITEGVLIGDFSRALSILRRLKALGVKIAMDDFGTGYSSLSYLQSFPFDKIKIDQAFISNLERNPQSSTIIRAVIGLARGLNVPVLAEGVETEEQLAFLARESCDEIQGYLIGRPLPIAEYAGLIGKPAKPARLAAVR